MSKAGRNAFYLYVQSIIAAGAGYVFWLIVSRLTDPEAIGLASTTLAISSIGASIASLGLPSSVRRFLGKAVVEDNLFQVKNYVNTSLLIATLAGVGISGTLLVLGGFLNQIIKIPFEFIIIAVVTLVMSALTSILTGTFVAILRTRTLLLAQVLASTLRIVVGVILVILGLGALGVAIGNSFVSIVLFIVLGLLISAHLRIIRRPNTIEMKKAARELMEAGSVNWVPNVIYMLGTQLGIIVVFGAYGAFEAGVYFIALAILSIITSIYSSIMGVAFPVLSGMTDGRRMAVWRATRLSLVFCMPLTLAALTFPEAILGIFGEGYAVADFTLSVLLFSMLPLIISTGVYTLVYAYGNYRQVLAIGLAGNVPSVVLYFFLTPSLGGLGASYAYLAGAISGAIVSVAVAHRIKMQIIWFDVYKATSVPLLIGSLAYLANLNWLVGGLAILFVSFLGYTRLNLLTKQDLKDLAEAILPRKVTDSVYQRLGWVVRILYG